jgi:uncharacterized protein YqgC (DUF456 family)
MSDGFLIAAAAVLLLLGFAGCLLPALPGPPLAYAGLLALHLSERVEFSGRLLAAGLALVVAVQVADAVIPAVGARRWGGTRWGVWGCVLGSLAGLLFFPPFGFVGGAFLGAVAGELLGGGSGGGGALKAGVGAFMGFLAGAALKLALCGLFAFWFVRALCA